MIKAHNPAHVAAFPPELPPTRRYTLGGDPAAEHQVQQDLSRLTADIDAELRPGLSALVLVGRFARGEGGVVLRAGEPHAVPSYRCLAFLESDRPELRRHAETLGQRWTENLMVPVHLHCHAPSTLRRARRTLWWLDVGRGNAEVLCGDRQILQHLRTLDVGDLPSDEAGWLLYQAAAELAIASLDTPGDRDAITSHLHRAALACGDATLLRAGRFGATLQSRETQLAGLNAPTEHVSAYHAATVHAGRPADETPPTDAELKGRAAMVAGWHLQIEHIRRDAPQSVAAFARHRGPLFRPPRVHPTRPSSWLRRLRHTSTEYPYVGDARERLARAAVALAYQGQDPSCRLMAARLLRLRARPSSSAIAKALADLLTEVRKNFQPDAVDAGFYG